MDPEIKENRQQLIFYIIHLMQKNQLPMVVVLDKRRHFGSYTNKKKYVFLITQQFLQLV
jgi:hypothetical protein